VETLEWIRRGIAEFVGAFAVVFIGLGAIIYQDPVVSALAYGFVIAVFVSAFAGVSGGHFNPAVTLGYLVTRRIPPLQGVFYWIVQFGAAALAALLLKWVEPSGFKTINDGAPAVYSGITSGKAVTIEAVCTFFVVLAVFATMVDARGAFEAIAGLAVGFAIALAFFMAGGLTGGAFNPARAFGPELVSNHWTNAWVWYVGPFAGGALAAILYELVYLGRPGHEEHGPPAELYTTEDEDEEVDELDVVEVVETAEEPEADGETEQPGGPEDTPPAGASPATDAPA
jgi:MIP family channel proteins